MARYERDYGWDFGGREPGPRRQQYPPYSGGMRSDGWGGEQAWRDFAGEEGWPGEGFGGQGGFYDVEYRGGGEREARRAWGGGGYGGRYAGPEFGGDFRGGYGGDLRSRGGRGRETGHRGRDYGYMEGWEERGRGRASSRSRYRAADIMTENPQSVTPDATIADVARKMRDLDVGIIPVVDNEEARQLRGVITDRDIAIRAIAEGKDGKAKVSECMTERIRDVNKNDSIQDVMRVMRREQVRRVPVTDREGRLVGIIAQADIAVDYAGDDADREMEVGEVLERISEPARPRREPAMAAKGGRQKQGSEE